MHPVDQPKNKPLGLSICFFHKFNRASNDLIDPVSYTRIGSIFLVLDLVGQSANSRKLIRIYQRQVFPI
ncbi:hypothetical protein MKX08_000250 [Trichoderma sp. CBMAI-0020]|nr:hypothetical protein MKX08_000250 [Trichoderma sp. CBMAI-0020]